MKTHSTPKTIFKLHSNHMHRCNDCSVCRPKTEHVVLCVVVLLLLSHGFYLVGEEMFCGCDKRTGIMALVRGHDFQLMITIYMPFRLQTIDGSQYETFVGIHYFGFFSRVRVFPPNAFVIRFQADNMIRDVEQSHVDVVCNVKCFIL